jgi:hypothetical protein
MSSPYSILPGTGRWHAEGLTEGAPHLRAPHRRAPSTSLRLVPLPVPGRTFA